MSMFDPNAKKFDLAAAEAMLGIDDEARELIRQRVALDLLLAHAGITDEQVRQAYAERVKNDVRDAAASLSSLAGDE
jgi:hypothetical protein